MATTDRVPVTVLTGFLGSGKTTLLNRILSENHGKRIAVIENEFGEVGVDHQLVIGAEEEIFETNNGCICCTVRGDLLRILGQLLKRRDKFDYIIIETTGMADPGPVAQTFFLDDDFKQQFMLDAIVTVVDARHIQQHLDQMDEPGEQVAFADVILLNKVDLVSEAELERIERRIRAINGTAKIFRTRNADVPVERVLDVGAFDLDRALAVDSAFLEPHIRSSGLGSTNWRRVVMNCERVAIRMITIITSTTMMVNVTMPITNMIITMSMGITTSTMITRMKVAWPSHC